MTDREALAQLDVPLLILDDLGTEKLTDWAAEKLDTLIDHRYIKGLSLVVTTNVPAAQLSPRIASRLQDRRPGRVVTVSGPDYRGGNAAERGQDDRGTTEATGLGRDQLEYGT